MPGAISFNTNSLQTTGIITSEIDHHSAPPMKLTKSALAHANKTAVIYSDFPEKNVKISGQLDGNGSINTMDALEDTFKGYLVGEDKYLDIEHNGSTRRYLATATAITIQRPGGLAYANFAVNFSCSLPFGFDTTTTSLLSETGDTTASESYAITVGGTFQWQAPIVEIEYTSITDGTAKTVTVGNADTGQQVSITRDWVTGEVLKVDVNNWLITVDDVEVDFSGAFPEFEPGEGTLSYVDNFTARTRNVDADYYRRFM